MSVEKTSDRNVEIYETTDDSRKDVHHTAEIGQVATDRYAIDLYTSRAMGSRVMINDSNLSLDMVTL